MSEFFDFNAEQYDWHVFGRGVPQLVQEFLFEEHYFINRFIGKFDGEFSIVDFGCGTGHYLRDLAPLLEWGIGIDRSAPMVAVAKTQLSDFPQIVVKEEDLCTAQPFQEGPPDIGICTYNTLGTIECPRRFLHSAFMVLQGAPLLLSFFAGEQFKASAEEVYHSWHKYVGPSEASSFDMERNNFINTKTKFTTHWTNMNELYNITPANIISRYHVGIGHFLVLNTSGNLSKREKYNRRNIPTGIACPWANLTEE